MAKSKLRPDHLPSPFPMAPIVSEDGSSVTLSAEEFQRLTATGPRSSNSASIASNRASTASSMPDSRLSRIPKPDGEAGRKPSDTRKGYNLLEESLLPKKQLKQLKLTVMRFTYKYLDIRLPFKKHGTTDKGVVITQCRELHPWLRFYEANWIVEAIMIKILRKTARDYRFKDCGEHIILEGMRKRKERDEEDGPQTARVGVSSRTPKAIASGKKGKKGKKKPESGSDSSEEDDSDSSSDSGSDDESGSDQEFRSDGEPDVEPPPPPKRQAKSVTVEKALETGITAATPGKATGTPAKKGRASKPKKGGKAASKPAAKGANTRGNKRKETPTDADDPPTNSRKRTKRA